MVLLAAIVVFVVDVSGFTESWKGWLSRWLGVKVGRVRPWDCSLCAVWWSCIILLLCRHALSLEYIAFAALLAAFSKVAAQVINSAVYAAQMGFNWLLILIEKIWQRK